MFGSTLREPGFGGQDGRQKFGGFNIKSVDFQPSCPNFSAVAGVRLIIPSAFLLEASPAYGFLTFSKWISQSAY